MGQAYDIIIVGGGMVGATLACALAGQGLHIALLEAQAPAYPDHPSYDERSVALAYGSARILRTLGLWPAHSVTAIDKIHISERGRFGIVRLSSAEEGVEALGYVVTNRIIGAMLNERIGHLPAIDFLCPARIMEIKNTSSGVSVSYDSGGAARAIDAKLLVAADGSQSTVRHLLGLDCEKTDYGQVAFVANVSPERRHEGVAYERFTDSGPLALLPLGEARCSVVFTVKSQDADTIRALGDDGFLHLLQQRFGERLGRFVKVGRRFAYPLSLLRTKPVIADRIAIIGNAAQTLHPVAGQGFNLGIRDIAALLDIIADAQTGGRDIGEQAVLNRYAEWRRFDQLRTVHFTNSLALLFNAPLLGPLRSLGMALLDLTPPAKHSLARQNMGLQGIGRLPRLARGLPLPAPAKANP